MKKSTKVLGLALALAPLSMLTACGGQLDSKPNVNVNSAGSYSATTSEDFNQAVYDETTHDVKSDFVAYKIGMTMEGKDNDGSKGEMRFVGIFKATEEKQEFAYSSYISADGVNATVKFYVPGDGYYYTDANIKGNTEGFNTAANGKFKMTEKVASATFDKFSTAEIAETYTYTNLLSMVGDLKSDNVTVEKAEKGTKANYKVTVAAGEYLGEQTIYFLYENGKIVACQYETKMENASLKITIEAFDGNIEYPNFSDFKDISLSGLLG